MRRNLGWMAFVAGAGVVAAAAFLLLRGGGPSPPGVVERPRTPPAAAGVLEGWAVRRGTFEALPARVAGTTREGETFRTTAGPEGRFRLEGLPRGALLDVEISCPGLATVRLPGLSVPREGTLDLARVTLGAPVAVTARIRRPDGRALPGASVRLRQAPAILQKRPVSSDETAPWPEVARAEADADGQATFGSVSLGWYRVEAGAPGTAIVACEVRVLVDATPVSVDVVLGEGSPLDVEVRDGEGVAAAGVLVRAVAESVVIEGTTGPEGYCRLEGLAPGAAMVWGILPSGGRIGGSRVDIPATGQVHLRAGPPKNLRGRVRDGETGAGLADAVVRLFVQSSPSALQAVSGPDGAFEVPLPGGKLVYLLAAAPGHLDGRWGFDDGGPDSLPSEGPVELRLRAAGNIRGVVLSEEGHPVPGASVQLAQATGPGGFAVGSLTAVCPDGSFVLGGARPGPAMVKVSAPGWWQPGYPQGQDFAAVLNGTYPPSCSTVVPDKGDASIRLVLRKGGTVSGTLVDAEGRPRAGMPLSLLREGSVQQDMAWSGADGGFAFHGLAPGKGLAVRPGTPAAGPAPVPPFDLPEGGSVEGLRVILPRSRSVHGVVLDAAGRPAAGAKVRVLPGNAVSHWDYGPMGQSPSATASPDGSFRVTDLLDAAVQVVLVRYPDHAEGALDLAGLGEGEDRGPVEVRLVREKVLTGTVVDEEGGPISGVQISAGPVRTTTDDKGVFVLRGLEGWPRTFSTYAPGFLQEFTLPYADEPRVVLVRSRTIHGRVRSARTGEPVAGMVVTATGVEPAPILSTGHTYSAADGSFRIDRLRAGPHTVAVQPTGPWLPPQSVRVEEGTGPVDFELEPGFPIAGRVLDGEGKPVAAGWVILGPEGSIHGASAQVIKGAFRFPALRAGRYGLTARSNAGRRSNLRTGDPVDQFLEDVEAGREDVEFRLLAAVDIRGRIEDATGQRGDLALSVVSLVPGTGKPKDGQSGWVKADASGAFTMPGVDPRRGCDLFLKGHPRGVGSFLRAVRPGGEEPVLVLGRGLTVSGVVQDEGGAPLRGLQVEAKALDARGPEDGVAAEAGVGEEGAFNLTGLGAFRFRVFVRTGGTDWAPAAMEVVAGEAKPLTFRLRPGAAIEGRVLGKGDRQLSISAMPVDGPESSGTYCRVGQDGTFSARGLAPGPHRLKIVDVRVQHKPQDAGIVDAPAAGLEFRFD